MEKSEASIKDIEEPQNDMFLHIKPLSMFERLRICLQVAICLAFLHSKDQVHGSVSAGSVALKEELPRNTSISSFVVTLRNQSLFATFAKGAKFMQVMEPARYMPPEYLQKDEVDPTKEGDVCSWALLAYAILSAMPLFPNQTHRSCVVRIAKRDFTRFKKPDDVPEVIWLLLQDCWKQAPNERPSITDVVTRLQSVGSFD
jgi:serine/threonine protein kinase